MFASIPRVPASIWLKVFARGLVLAEAAFATEFFRTRPPVTPAALSLRPPRGLEEGVVVECSFCWCRSSRSRLAKHLVHSGHSKGFSFVCDLS